MAVAIKRLFFWFGRNFLMRRWVVECNHAWQKLPPVEKKSEHWQDVVPIKPVKAILTKMIGLFGSPMGFVVAQNARFLAETIHRSAKL